MSRLAWDGAGDVVAGCWVEMLVSPIRLVMRKVFESEAVSAERVCELMSEGR